MWRGANEGTVSIPRAVPTGTGANEIAGGAAAGAVGVDDSGGSEAEVKGVGAIAGTGVAGAALNAGSGTAGDVENAAGGAAAGATTLVRGAGAKAGGGTIERGTGAAGVTGAIKAA